MVDFKQLLQLISCSTYQIDVIVLRVCSLIDDKLRNNIVKVAVEPQANIN